MKIFLVKHAEALQDLLDMAAPLPSDEENGLTNAGQSQAIAVGSALAVIGGSYDIFCSPSRRCLDTAELIARETGGVVQTSVSLAERQLIEPDAVMTISDYRIAQERAYLDPYSAALGCESAVSHRLRVEGWLAGQLTSREPDRSLIVVSHGSTIEHLQSSLSWKPAGGMVASFAMCRPGHAHVWASVDVPDGRYLWCLLGSNVWLPDMTRADAERAERDIATLAAQLSGAPSFDDLMAAAEKQQDRQMYYIR